MATKKIEKKEEKVKGIELNPKVWDVKYNADLVAQVLLVMRSNARQANASAKNRSEVSGGGRKPWKQKGTGRARSGSNRSPLWVKGGVTFPPTLRTWTKKINKKMRKLALCVVLSKKLKEEKIEFVNIKSEGKNAEIRKMFDVKTLVNGKNLVVTDKKEYFLALRNVENVDVVMPNEINVINLVSARKIFVDNEIVNVIEKQLLNEN